MNPQRLPISDINTTNLMASDGNEVHMVFLVDAARGLMIPAVDMARMFARQGAKTTIITTPIAATTISKAIERDQNSGFHISLHTLKFPAAEVGLPEGSENASSLTSPDMISKFFKAIAMLQEPFEQFLQHCNPTCLVAAMSFLWAKQVAEKFGIPRFFFSGHCCFSACVFDCLKKFQPFKKVDSDFEQFSVPGIPDQIKMKKFELPSFLTEESDDKSELAKLLDQMKDAERTSHGILANSFYDLEPAYAELFSNITGRKIWLVGPVSSFNKMVEDKLERGDSASINGSECLEWLDSKKPNSVLYICFGSVINFSTTQLREIASGLELSGKNFIWAVRNREKEAEEWLPEGFGKRMEGKGLIIRGWAPQVLILDHEAIGGFVTHCGWNSTLEALTAGVPMVTWPLMAEQFVNEKLITDVLKVGVGVGAEEWSRFESKNVIRKEEIEKAVSKLMDGDDAESMRNRAKALKEKAKLATEDGGSSESCVKDLLEQLKSSKTSN